MKMNLKGNKGASNAIVIILLLIIFILAGFMVYFIRNPKIEYVAKQEAETQIQTSTPETKTEVVTAKMTADEKYAEYVKNLKAEMLKYNEEKVDGKEYRTYNADGKDSNDKNYNIELYGNGKLELNEKEVATNVIGFNVAYTGNGGYKNLYFIKEDGTVAWASIDETEYLSNGKVKTTEVKSLKNIVSIIGGTSGKYGYPGAEFAYAIDIDGNVFEIK